MSAGTAAFPPWRFASRLARREVRRHRGRTILVSLLVAVPVMGMTVFSALSRTFDGDDSLFRRFPDGTDLVVTQPLDSTVDVAEHLPATASLRSAVGSDSVPIETAGGAVVDDVAMFDSAPIGEPGSVYSISTGERPEDGDVWLSTALADELGVSVGDEVNLQHPAGTWMVSGVGRDRTDFDRYAMVLPDLDVGAFRDGAAMRWSFVDLPGGASGSDAWAVADPLSRLVNEETDGGWVNWQGEPYTDGSVHTGALAWGWVAGTIALAATGIIVAGAFATSARRQLTTIGLLSSNGASEKLTRRTLALQGLWTGVLGSLTGVAVGVALLLALRSTIEGARHRALLPYRFAALDLAVIVVTGIAAATVAALVPARTASRVPVMAALAGRRPLGAVPRRLVPTGIGLFALGVFLLVVAASSNGGNAPAAAAVLGGVSVLAGVCCCTPLAIDSMARVAARLGGSWRFAGRSLARTRTRSAAVVTAIAVTGALSVAGSAVAERIDDGGGAKQLPADAVLLIPDMIWPDESGGFVDFDAAPEQPIDESQRTEMSEIVPSAQWHDRRVATWDPAPSDVDGPIPMPFLRNSIVVADEELMDLYELTDGERSALDETGLLALQSWVLIDMDDNPFDESSGESITISTEDGDLALPFAARDHVLAAHESYLQDGTYDDDFEGIYGFDDFMITEEAARRAGFDIAVSGALLRSDAPLTEAQRSALDDVAYGSEGDLGDTYRDVPLQGGGTIFAIWHTPDWSPPPLVVQASIVGAALLLTLLVVAIGLALAATESHDERDVLVAVGARPRTMRSMAGAKAAVITVTGVVLAIPAGLIPVAAVMRAVDEPFEMPWAALAGLLIVVPLIAGGAAWLVSSIAQRTRPPQMSALAFE